MIGQKWLTFEQAVFSLIPELLDTRQEFIKILNLLDDFEAYREIIVNAGSQAENLIEKVEDSSGARTKDISLINRIDNLMNKGILPAEIASYFHTIRVFANKARHGAEKIGFNMRDIENILGILLRIYEWFYCEYEKGPNYSSIYREIPNIKNLAKNTIVPNGALYCFGTPLLGLFYKWVGIKNEVGFLSLILFVLVLSFLEQFWRTKKFLGLRSHADYAQRFRSCGALFFVSLLVILNSPLLTTSYTGIDPYGIFLLFAENAKLWAIVANLMINFVLASIATLLFFWISLEWTKRKPHEFINSSFSSVLVPLIAIYVVIVLTQSSGMESYFLVAFFPTAAAFIAIVGYSHSNNQLEPFTAKLLFVLCIVFMVVGFVLALGGMLFKLYEFTQGTPQNLFETPLWKKAFNWNELGMDPKIFIEKLKLGFQWTVLTASFYLELAVGYSTAMTIYHYQLRPAINRQLEK